jgi:hypothetical protein
MSSVAADSFGDFVPEPRPTDTRGVDVRDKPSRHSERPLVSTTPTYGQEPDVGKWPAWKVTLFVVVFCGAFWGGLIYLGMRLFGS